MIREVEAHLQGWPDRSLSIALIAAAAVLVLIALLDHPLLKAAALAWVIAP